MFEKKYDFQILIPRSSPYYNAELALKDGKFYGLTFSGGAKDDGVIFEWNPDTNTYTKKIDFDGYLGSKPHGSLTLKDGKFYGMTWEGGDYAYGVIFEWDPETNTFNKLLMLTQPEVFLWVP